MSMPHVCNIATGHEFEPPPRPFCNLSNFWHWHFLHNQQPVLVSQSQFAGPISLPIFGSALFIDVRNLGKSFKRLGSRYGDIFSIFIGRKPCVVLNSYPVIKEAFAIPEFNGRPAMFSGTFFQKGKDGIITSEGSMWEAQRDFFHQRMVDLVKGKGTQGFQVRKGAKSYTLWLQKTWVVACMQPFDQTSKIYNSC